MRLSWRSEIIIIADKLIPTSYLCILMYRYICYPYSYTLKACTYTYTYIHHGNVLIIASNANKAIAFAGNALRKHGRNPRQYPLHPLSW